MNTWHRSGITRKHSGMLDKQTSKMLQKAVTLSRIPFTKSFTQRLPKTVALRHLLLHGCKAGNHNTSTFTSYLTAI